MAASIAAGIASAAATRPGRTATPAASRSARAPTVSASVIVRAGWPDQSPVSATHAASAIHGNAAPGTGAAPRRATVQPAPATSAAPRTARLTVHASGLDSGQAYAATSAAGSHHAAASRRTGEPPGRLVLLFDGRQHPGDLELPADERPSGGPHRARARRRPQQGHDPVRQIRRVAAPDDVAGAP